MNPGVSQQKPAPLQPQLAELQALGAERFDPVRFRYIETMARRSAELDGAVAEIVAGKAVLALQNYHSALSRARTEGQSLLERIANTRPELEARARALFDAFDFRALRRLAAGRQPDAGALSVLLDRLDGNGSSAGCSAIGELLRRQEADAIRSVSADTNAAPATNPGELRAASYFRDARRQRHAETVVSRAVLAAPEDSGPLNPQKLATRSLSAMGKLSPAYLGRFVASVETMLWLEKAGETGKP